MKASWNGTGPYHYNEDMTGFQMVPSMTTDDHPVDITANYVGQWGIKEGDKIQVKLIDIDQKTGKYKLSRRVLVEKPEGYQERERRPRPERGERRPRPERGERRPRPERGERRPRPEQAEEQAAQPVAEASQDFTDALDKFDF